MEQKASNVYANFTITNASVVMSFSEKCEKLGQQLDDLKLAVNWNKTAKDYKEFYKISEQIALIRKNLTKRGDRIKPKLNEFEKVKASIDSLEVFRGMFDELNSDTMRNLQEAFQTRESFTEGAKLSIEHSETISEEALETLEVSLNTTQEDLYKNLQKLEFYFEQTRGDVSSSLVISVSNDTDLEHMLIDLNSIVNDF
jgi:histidyl-tRNA synthetase